MSSPISEVSVRTYFSCFSRVLGLAVVTIVASCAEPPKPAPPPPPPRVLPPHMGPAKAEKCTVAPFTANEGSTTTIVMAVSNEGGYCAAQLVNAAGNPYDIPLVVQEAKNGTQGIWKYDGKTSIEYTPNTGFNGIDSFSVKLRNAGKPGTTVVNVSVSVGNVTPPPAVAPAPTTPAPAPAAKPATGKGS